MKESTLCLILDRERGEMLMIEKKRGQGAGKWNMPGGKVDAGETIAEAAAREALEETGIQPIGPTEIGVLEFFFEDNTDEKNWDNRCHVFVADRYEGALIPQSDECDARWVPIISIPYDRMWEDDAIWVPLALKGEKFHFVCRFGGSDRMTSMRRIL